MSVLSPTAQQQVQDELVKYGLMDAQKLTELQAKAKANNKPLFGLLASEGGVSEEDLTKTIAFVTRVPYVNLLQTKIEPKILELLPADLAERYMVVPLGEMQYQLVVAMLDADNVQAVDFLSSKVGRPLKVYVASETGIRNVLKQYQNNTNLSDAVVGAISAIGGDIAAETERQTAESSASGISIGGKNIKTLVQDSPISKALTTILDFAARNRASDIHIEPLEDALRIRCRVDGVLREIMKLPKTTEPPLVSRIKILSNLKIDEHRIPQDGCAATWRRR